MQRQPLRTTRTDTIFPSTPLFRARVNARLSDTLIPLIEPEHLLWIHDYHLFPLGRELRRRGCTNRIGVFLHTPWPAAGILRTLPSCRQLVESMFHYDVVGFQTAE